MFANIRRHQKWLWILISGAVIVSFTWYLNPNSSGGGGFSRGSKVGSVNGHDITRGEYVEAEKGAQLRYYTMYGTWYGADEFSRQHEGFIERETKNRLLLKDKIKEYNIHVTPDDIANWITEAFGRERFTAEQYEGFIKSIEQRGFRERDFEKFVEIEVGVGHLLNLAGIPGRLITPQEAESEYRRANEQVSAQIAIFSLSNYLAKVNIDPTALASYYTNQQAAYREPEKIQLAYVEFPASNHWAAADQKLVTITNLNQQIDAMYAQRGEKFFTDTNGAQMTPEAAKKKIRDEIRNNAALIESQRIATEFAEALLNASNKTIAAFDELAKQRGLTVKTTEPFAQFESPSGMEVPERFSQLAFQLTPEEPYIAEPIRGTDSVYIAGLRNRIASVIPGFDQVREKLVADYKRDEAQKMMFDDARATHSKLTNSIASGKSFMDAAKEAGLKASVLEPFSQSSRTIAGLDPRIDAGSVRSAAFSLKPGEMSSFRPTRDGGFILYVLKTLPVSDQVVKTGLPEFMRNLQREGQQQAFNEWFSKQFQNSRLSLITDKDESATTTQ